MTREAALSVLGLGRLASPREIIDAYRRLASHWHPDRWLTPGEKAMATKRFQRIAESFEFTREGSAQTGESQVSGNSQPVGAYQDSEQSDSPPNAWELIRDRAPRLYVVAGILFGTMLPLMALFAFVVIALNPPTRIRNVLSTIGLRLITPIASVALGVYGLANTQWAWIFIASGIMELAMELLAQVLGVVQLRRDRPRLALVLARLNRDAATST